MTSPTTSDTTRRRPAPLMYVPQLSVAVRARWKLVAGGLILGLLGGILLALQMPTQYAATATVQLGSGFVPAGQVTDATRAGDTQQELAVLQPRLEEIARVLDVDVEVVEANLDVATRRSTSLMDFSYAAETVEDAERGAAVAAQVYLDRALQTARDQIDGRIALLQERASGASPANRPAIARDLRNLKATMVEPGSMVRDPAGSADPSVLQPWIYVAIGLLGGGILGALLALLVEAAGPRIRPGVPVPGLRLLGRITGEVRPRQAEEILVPALVSSESGALLVPIGPCADAVAELLTRTVPDVSMIDHADRADLTRAATDGEVVLLVLEEEPVRRVRTVVETLAMVDVAPAGMVTVTTDATRLAMQVLVEAETDGPGRSPRRTQSAIEALLGETE